MECRSVINFHFSMKLQILKMWYYLFSFEVLEKFESGGTHTFIIE